MLMGRYFRQCVLGRKRHIVTDTLGLLIGLLVHGDDVQRVFSQANLLPDVDVAGLRDFQLLQPVEWQQLVRFAEESASCEIWPMLKRADEKWVTERAYDNPKFVEDLVRDVALRLQADSRISIWSVTAENFESIHNHSAYAELRGTNA